MNERLQKERTEEIIDIARQQLNDERVQEQLGARGKVLRFVAGMMRVPDIDGGYLVEFPDYENKDIFPVVSLMKDASLLSTMTARMPIQQAVIRERATRQWDGQGVEYTEEDIQLVLSMSPGEVLRLNYGHSRSGFHRPYKNILLHQSDDEAPAMVQVGRPHIALQSSPGSKVKDKVSTLVHELSHAVDAIAEPVVFMDIDSELRELQLSRLRGELAAYATESVVRRVFRSKSEALRNFFIPDLCDTVESYRSQANGPYTAEGAFDPKWSIERRLGKAGLKRIYWQED